MSTESIEVIKRNIYAWEQCNKNGENGQLDCGISCVKKKDHPFQYNVIKAGRLEKGAPH